MSKMDEAGYDLSRLQTIASWLEVYNAPTLEAARKIADDCLLLAGVWTRDAPGHQGYHDDADRIRNGIKEAVAKMAKARSRDERG